MPQPNDTVCIIGLGYVGLAMTAAYLKAGFSVIGIDTELDRIRQIETGNVELPESDRQEVAIAIIDGRLRTNRLSAREAAGFLVCVPPGDGARQRTLNGALDYVRNNLCCGHVVILISTLYPGTTRFWADDLRKSTGLIDGDDFFIAHSPERIDLGNKCFSVSNTPRLVGGLSSRCTRATMLLLSPVCERLVPVSSPETAEFAKLLENTYRLVNVTLANEVADIARPLGVNPYEVVAAAATKPFGFASFQPGIGAGGHCIPIVPQYLAEAADQLGIDTPLIDCVLTANITRPCKIAQEIAATYTGRILVVGIAYKSDTRDTRNSMALRVIEELGLLGIVADFYDPNVVAVHGMAGIAIDDIPDMSYNVAVILVKHSCLPWDKIRRVARQVVDFCGATFTGIERG